MNNETLIEVSQLSCYYGDHCAVNEISFSVNRGEVLGFLGPNGAGKSSTMQIICGVLAATAGSVVVASHDIVEAAEKAKQHIGFLPENPPLYKDLTVDEYLLYCARLRKIQKNQLKQAMDNCKSRCGIHDYGKRLIANLSKGYQQRVGIAQAIIHSPAVVILDEPSSGLDPIQNLEIRELISELGSDHSVIVSTHILPEVQSSCNRVLIINRGKIVLDEKINQLEESGTQSSWTIALARPPLLEELEQISGVSLVRNIDGRRFRVVCENSVAAPALFTETSVNKNWGLYELIPERESLEHTFLQLTHGEVVEQGASSAEKT
ncbi:MAG: ATP-binding cassette domain-containing protein [Gammaproteobacteria bacterium]|nr:ATP-binding cassette domain-containing protein [Gammaproteobacteria bacterium]